MIRCVVFCPSVDWIVPVHVLISEQRNTGCNVHNLFHCHNDVCNHVSSAKRNQRQNDQRQFGGIFEPKEGRGQGDRVCGTDVNT